MCYSWNNLVTLFEQNTLILVRLIEQYGLILVRLFEWCHLYLVTLFSAGIPHRRHCWYKQNACTTCGSWLKQKCPLLVQSECVCCPWLLAQMKVATILGIFYYDNHWSLEKNTLFLMKYIVKFNIHIAQDWHYLPIKMI